MDLLPLAENQNKVAHIVDKTNENISRSVALLQDLNYLGGNEGKRDGARRHGNKINQFVDLYTLKITIHECHINIPGSIKMVVQAVYDPNQLLGDKALI